MFVYEIAYASEISITKDNGKLIVRAGTELFTKYIYDDPNRFKPVLYPVIGPRGIARTRQYPLEGAKDGEAEDHPHHASLWYSHGEVNGIDFLTKLTGWSIWKQTSYNTLAGQHKLGGTPFRKNHAAIGYTYDEDRDAFIPPKPFNSWILNEDTCQWEPPVVKPIDNNNYIWNEETQQWDLNE